MTRKLIVFDWNGTLLADTIPSWRASNECLKLFGQPEISLAKFRDTFDFPVIHYYTRNGVSVDELLSEKEKSNTFYQETYERMAARTRLRSGARELLEWCNAQGHTCIILSNYLTEKIEAHLARLKIRHHFQHVDAHNCDGSTILQNTTKTKRLSEYMVKRGYKPQDTTIIGDSLAEPDIARHLGLTSISITDGCISRARLIKANPDHLITSLKDVAPLLSS